MFASLRTSQEGRKSWTHSGRLRGRFRRISLAPKGIWIAMLEVIFTPVRQEYLPLHSPIFTRQEFSRESSSHRSLNRSFSYRKSRLTNKAPIRLSHARKSSESYCRRHFHCSCQCEMKHRASSVVGIGPQTATIRIIA